jgi:hypothetical protein
MATTVTCLAASDLQKDATNLCHSLLFYGEGPANDLTNGVLYVSRMLEPLQRLLRLISQCEQVLSKSLNQLAALVSATGVKSNFLFGSSAPELYFYSLVDSIAELLLTLIKIQVQFCFSSL